MIIINCKTNQTDSIVSQFPTASLMACRDLPSAQLSSSFICCFRSIINFDQFLLMFLQLKHGFLFDTACFSVVWFVPCNAALLPGAAYISVNAVLCPWPLEKCYINWRYCFNLTILFLLLLLFFKYQWVSERMMKRKYNSIIIFKITVCIVSGAVVAQWLGCCVTDQKIRGSSPVNTKLLLLGPCAKAFNALGFRVVIPCRCWS